MEAKTHNKESENPIPITTSQYIYKGCLLVRIEEMLLITSS